jgi:hypothetical protein
VDQDDIGRAGRKGLEPARTDAAVSRQTGAELDVTACSMQRSISSLRTTGCGADGRDAGKAQQ